MLDQLFDDPLTVVCWMIAMVVGVITVLLDTRFHLIYIWRHPPDRTSERHGGQLVADVLVAHGVQRLYTLVGGHISPVLVAAEKAGVRVVDTRHEATAVFAADAEARLTGGVGVAAVTAGPGLTNTLTAVKNAQLAESPLLLLAGAAASLLKGRGALQDMDQLLLLRSVCKHTVSVRCVRDIASTLCEAIQRARSDVPGPVFVELPIDVLYPYQLVGREVAAQPSAGRRSGLFSRVVQLYLTNYVDNIFAGAWESEDVSPLPVSMPLASASQVSRAAALLASARRPLVLVGSGAVIASPVPAAETRRLLERLQLPCYLTGAARGLLGADSRLQLRHERRAALRRADVVLLLGVPADFRLQYGRALPAGGRVLAVHRNPQQLRLNARLFWRPELAVCADVASFLRDLCPELLTAVDGGQQLAERVEWLQELRERDTTAKQRIDDMAASGTPAESESRVNPLQLLRRLDAQLPEDSVLVADGGDFVGSAAYTLRARGPLSWLDPGPFGTLGVGAGFALAAKLVRPQAQVWLIYGDGSCGYSVAEFDTFTRHRTPVIALVGNDAGWTQIAREQVPIFGTDVACRLAHTRYDAVAEGFGGVGILLQHDAEIDAALRTAQKGDAEDRCVLINALIANTKFREGSVSV